MEVLQRTANRGSISTASAYEVDNSVKLEPDNSEFFQRAASGSSGNLKTWTFSLWLKRTELSHACIFYSQGSYGRVRFETDDTLTFYFNSGHELSTTRRFRDTSAWYHIVLAVDTTDGTAANRLKVYVNGVQETMSGTQPSQNEEGDFGKFASVTAQLGQFVEGSYYFAGYMAEFYWIDGIQQAPTEFGEFDDNSGIWRPIEYTGSFGNEGSFLNFSSPSDMGNDHSGNNNDYAVQNVNQNDQATDTPTNNFCTFNAVNMYGNTAKLAEGATFTASTANGAFTTYGTMAPSAGKWWWEGKIQVFESGSTYACIGATTNLAGLPSVSAQLSGGHVIKLAKNQKWVLNSTGYTYGATYADADIINVGLDLDNRKFYTYKNGTIDDANGIDISSTTFDGFGSQWMPLVITYGSGGASSYEINFGGYRTYGIGSAASDANGYGTFEFAPPSGYYALCTKNLAEFG